MYMVPVPINQSNYNKHDYESLLSKHFAFSIYPFLKKSMDIKILL